MFYEIFLTMQLVHLNCRKGHVQSPTRKEGWDLFRRTSDDNSINMNLKLPRSETSWRRKELQRAVESTLKDEDHHGYERSFDQRVTIDHEEWYKEKYIVSSIWIYKNKCTKQGSWFSSERIDYDMTYSIDKYISSIESAIQNEEGRWYSTSGGVTTKYI